MPPQVFIFYDFFPCLVQTTFHVKYRSHSQLSHSNLGFNASWVSHKPPFISKMIISALTFQNGENLLCVRHCAQHWRLHLHLKCQYHFKGTRPVQTDNYLTTELSKYCQVIPHFWWSSGTLMNKNLLGASLNAGSQPHPSYTEQMFWDWNPVICVLNKPPRNLRVQGLRTTVLSHRSHG